MKPFLSFLGLAALLAILTLLPPGVSPLFAAVVTCGLLWRIDWLEHALTSAHDQADEADEGNFARAAQNREAERRDDERRAADKLAAFHGRQDEVSAREFRRDLAQKAALQLLQASGAVFDVDALARCVVDLADQTLVRLNAPPASMRMPEPVRDSKGSEGGWVHEGSGMRWRSDASERAPSALQPGEVMEFGWSKEHAALDEIFTLCCGGPTARAELKRDHPPAPGEVIHAVRALVASIRPELSGVTGPVGKHFAEEVAARDAELRERSCAACGWPLHEQTKDGCTCGNCSQRPLPDPMRDPARYAAEQGRPVLPPRITGQDGG